MPQTPGDYSNNIPQGARHGALWTETKMQLCDIVREMVSGDLAIVTHIGCYLSFSAKSLARRLTAWPVKYRIVTLGTGRCLLFQGKLFLKL